MKSIILKFFVFALAISAILFTSCDNTTGGGTVTIELKPTRLTIGGNGGKELVEVVTTSTNWKVEVREDDEDWLEADKLDKEDLEEEGIKGGIWVTAKPNNTGVERNGRIYVTSGQTSETLRVTQSAGGTGPGTNTLSVNPSSLSFEANETSSKTATVTTNASDWSFNSSAAWLNVVKDGNNLVVNPTSANTSSDARSATISVTAGDATPVNVSVSQSGTGSGPGPTQVRFQKEKEYMYVTIIGVAELQGNNIVEWKAQHEFGTADGTSPYYEIPSGNWAPLFWYNYTGDEGWYACLGGNPPTYNFQAGTKYSVVCSDEGGNLVFRVTNDGSSKSGVSYVSTTETIKIPKSSAIFSSEKFKADVKK